MLGRLEGWVGYAVGRSLGPGHHDRQLGQSLVIQRTDERIVKRQTVIERLEDHVNFHTATLP